MAIRIGTGTTRRRSWQQAGCFGSHDDRRYRPPVHQPRQDRPLITHGLQSGMSRSIPASSGRAPIGRRACWSKSPRPTASRTIRSTASSMHCRKVILPPSFWLRTCRPHRTSSIECDFRTSRPRPLSASRKSAGSAPRRATDARSVSSGRAIQPGKAGASMNRAAACAPTRRC